MSNPQIPREKIPPSNSPNFQRPWSRWVEERIGILVLRVNNMLKESTSVNKQLNSTVSTLSKQVKAINAQRIAHVAELANYRSGFVGFDEASPGAAFVVPTSRIKVTLSGATNNGSVSYTYALYDFTESDWMLTGQMNLDRGAGKSSLDLSSGDNFINSGSRTWVENNMPIGHEIGVFAMSVHADALAVSFFKSVLVESLPSPLAPDKTLNLE